MCYNSVQGDRIHFILWVQTAIAMPDA